MAKTAKRREQRFFRRETRNLLCRIFAAKKVLPHVIETCSSTFFNLSSQLFRSVVRKVILDQDHRRSAVAAAAGQVAETAQKVRELSRRRALRGHIPHEVRILGFDFLFHCLNFIVLVI